MRPREAFPTHRARTRQEHSECSDLVAPVSRACRVGILKVVERGGSRRDSFGARLRGLREAAGLTQEELASMAGLTARVISIFERGLRSHTYPYTVRLLADAINFYDERTGLLEAVPRRDGEVDPEPAPILPVPLTPLVGRE
jgi:DNA-binding XRE family transcriptional regulator